MTLCWWPGVVQETVDCHRITGSVTRAPSSDGETHSIHLKLAENSKHANPSTSALANHIRTAIEERVCSSHHIHGIRSS